MAWFIGGNSSIIFSFSFFFFGAKSIAGASFCFSVKTPALPGNADFFSLASVRVEISSSDFC